MRIALAGNPNSGKTSLFNKLTGLRQKTGNFPGVTVEKKSGKLKLPDGQEVELVDLPGAYSLYPSSQDERIVLDVLTNPDDLNYPDAIVYVADITNLEKHLLLLTQIIDLGFPTFLALNMSDLAQKRDLHIDKDKLSALLKMPVVETSGRTGDNIKGLKAEIANLTHAPQRAHQPFYKFTKSEKNISQAVQSVLDIANPYRAKLIAHHHEQLPFLSSAQKEKVSAICEKEGFQDLRLQITETMQRFEQFVPVLRSVITQKTDAPTSLTDKLDAVLTHRTFAPIIFFVIMFFVFQAIYAWAAYPMEWIDTGFSAMGNWVKTSLPQSWLTELLADGILSGLGGILVFVPQIAILFFLISLLEEVGYMARAVYIFDKLMQQFGLNGRSVVALVSGGACAIPAILSTRTIGNWKERLITIMVTPLVSCSARIPVYAILIGFVVPNDMVLGFVNLQGLAFMGLYLLGIMAALFSAFVFKKILKSEEKSFLMIELPSYRWPVWRNVWQNILRKVSAFVLGAGKVIIVISIALWFLATYGPTKAMEEAESSAVATAQAQALDEAATADLIASKRIEASYAGILGKTFEPAIKPLGFDWKIGIALITSFAAREVFVGTMATIYSIGSTDDESTIQNKLAEARNPETGAKVYSAATSLSLLIFYVFAMQCMSTLAVVRRETGSWKWAAIQFAYMSALAYIGSFITFQIMS